MEKDRLGRRRQPGQVRGLRSLHPCLPDEWTSRPVRIAMSSEDWERFAALVQRVTPIAETQARAHGLVISHLMHEADEENGSKDTGATNWMDWERQKTLRLLRSAV